MADCILHGPYSYRCKPCRSSHQAAYHQKIKHTDRHKSRHLKSQKTYYIKNREILIEKERVRRRRKYNTDPLFRIVCSLRSRTCAVLSNKNKSYSTFKLIGCNRNRLISYIERLFEDGMSWNNYGEWHVDHIIPLSQFDLMEAEEQRRAFNFSNLRPLWAKDNLSKGSK